MNLSSLLNSPLSRLILRPSYDRMAVPLLARVYFPVSRLWALALAAPAARSDVEVSVALRALVSGLAGVGRGLERAVTRTRKRAAVHDSVHARWRALTFGIDGVDPTVPSGVLAALEAERAAAAQALMTTRVGFLPFARAKGLEPFGWDIATPAAVEARHGRRRANPDAAFAVPDGPDAIVESRVVPGDGWETLWLRAETTVAGEPDTLWARVERPLGAARAGPAPAIVFTHGIAMETEFWRGIAGPVTELARAGVWVVRPEGPWHGRRRVPGRFGGEPVLATGPLGMLDYFEAHARELARLVRWARAAAGGPVAVGGVSLGALVAQLALAAAPRWPAPCRPDAGLLVTTSGSLMDVALAGGLTAALGLPARLAAAGWDEAALAPWLPLLEPGPAAPLDPARIVAVLGSEDEITPYGGGRALATAWGVPVRNLFVRPLGHFSAALGLYRDEAPLARLHAVLREAGRRPGQSRTEVSKAPAG